MAATLNWTTISAAVDNKQKTIPLTSLTSVVKNDLLVVGGEAMKITRVDSVSVEVLRGYAGTHARAHATLTRAYTGTEDKFSQKLPTGETSATVEVALPRIVLAGGSARVFALASTRFVEVTDSPYVDRRDEKTQRFRATIAEVNAGLTLLPALVGFKYRITDVIAISVGGAAAAVTTVDIIGTQTTAVKLAAFAQASLTQSTVLRPGVSGCTVLADGASFVACDANTAITIGKTGSNVTTATHIDVILSYVIEE